MKRERPHAIPCTFCKRYPLAAVGQLVRCKTKDCVHYRRGFKTVVEWNAAQQQAVIASIAVCREYGMLIESR